AASCRSSSARASSSWMVKSIGASLHLVCSARPPTTPPFSAPPPRDVKAVGAGPTSPSFGVAAVEDRLVVVRRLLLPLRHEAHPPRRQGRDARPGQAVVGQA